VFSPARVVLNLHLICSPAKKISTQTVLVFPVFAGESVSPASTHSLTPVPYLLVHPNLTAPTNRAGSVSEPAPDHLMTTTAIV
jgi:hypothetical protein